MLLTNIFQILEDTLWAEALFVVYGSPKILDADHQTHHFRGKPACLIQSEFGLD